MMRILVLFAALVLAVNASADDKKKVPVKRIDMASPMAQAVTDEDTDPGPNRGALAQDYNSSRSNNTMGGIADNGSGDDDGATAERHAENRGFNSSRLNTSSDNRADGDYNSSRSNNINGFAPADGGDDNSSRSDRTHAPALDPDSDGDAIDAVCGNGVDDDCDGVRAAPPANHNTTRSNKTSE